MRWPTREWIGGGVGSKEPREREARMRKKTTKTIERFIDMADGVAVSGVEKRNKHQRGTQTDEGDPAVARLKPPEVQRQDFADTQQKHAQAGKSEAAFFDEVPAGRSTRLHSPRHGNHAGLHFNASMKVTKMRGQKHTCSGRLAITANRLIQGARFAGD